jgi:hypothetical protein
MHNCTMTTLKRKATEMSDATDVQLPVVKKAKANAGAAFAAQAMAIFDNADESPDEYEPEQVEEVDDDVPGSPQQRRHKAKPVAALDEKQRLLDEQVAFIILTRDNNLPNPYGLQSTAAGTLSWPKVADAYNEKFLVNVGSAAMEKRARQHREAWMAARPDYPRAIVYTQKVKAEKVKTAKPKVAREQPHVTDHAMEAPKVGLGKYDKAAAHSKPDVIDFDAEDADMSLIGGWLPPDEFSNMTVTRTPVSGDEQQEWMVIEVENTDETPLGEVHVRVQDIGRSSKCIAAELKYETDLRYKLVCPSKSAVDRYVQCVSTAKLTTLPDWDTVSLIGIYAIAAQMEDEWVKGLILRRWQEMFQRNVELNLGSEDLNNIFHSTEPKDPAREFWVKALYDGGMAEEVAGLANCHTTLKAWLEDMVADAARLSPVSD